MPALNIKSTHKSIRTYYTELDKYAQLGQENESTVRAAFQKYRCAVLLDDFGGVCSVCGENLPL